MGSAQGVQICQNIVKRLLWTSLEHHFGVLEAPQDAHWETLGPHCTHVRVWKLFYAHFGTILGTQMDPTSGKMYVQGTSQQRLWKSCWKSIQHASTFDSLDPSKLCEGLQNRGFHDFGNQPIWGSRLPPFWEPWGAKWYQLGGSRAMSKAGLFPGASKGHPDPQ